MDLEKHITSANATKMFHEYICLTEETVGMVE